MLIVAIGTATGLVIATVIAIYAKQTLIEDASAQTAGYF